MNIQISKIHKHSSSLTTQTNHYNLRIGKYQISLKFLDISILIAHCIVQAHLSRDQIESNLSVRGIQGCHEKRPL